MGTSATNTPGSSPIMMIFRTGAKKVMSWIGVLFKATSFPVFKAMAHFSKVVSLCIGFKARMAAAVKDEI